MQIELKRLQHETGITFIFVTHDQEEALTMSDRIAVMSQGQDPAGRLARATSTTARPSASSPTSSARPISSKASWPASPDGEATREARRRRDDQRRPARRAASRRARSPSWSGRSMPTSSSPAARPISGGTLENIVYFGTDTHYHVRLDGGDDLHRPPAEHARRRHAASQSGDAVGIALERRCRPGPEGLTMASAAARPQRRPSATTSATAGCSRRRRSLIIFFAAVGPLLVVLLYSFLAKGAYGDVKYWQFSTDAWFSVLLRARHLRRHAVARRRASHRSSGARSSCRSSPRVVTLIFGFPTAYFIATRPRAQRDIWLFLITIPFWTNLLIRTFAMQEVIRNEGIINTSLIGLGHHRPADPDHVHRLAPSCSAWSMSTCR